MKWVTCVFQTTLNNVKSYSLTQSGYGQYFGFTEEEVLNLLDCSGLRAHAQEIRDWYNGYQIGKWTVYNPWSIANCIDEEGRFSSYWVNTSDNELIKEILTHSGESFRAQFEDLLRGESVEKRIDEKVVFADLKINETAAWTILLMAGYLKVVAERQTEMGTYCTLSIPNREVRGLYRGIIEQWMSNGRGTEWFENFLSHLLAGNLTAFEADFQHLVEDTFSVHDTSKDPEAFYHGFMVGATASLYHNKNYEIKSNRESGYGRYGYMIFSHDISKPTILIEIKRVKMKEKISVENLDKALTSAAQQALVQIQKLNYLSEAMHRGRMNILMIGLAFCSKHFKIQSEKKEI